MTKGDLRVAFFLPMKRFLQANEDQLWEPGLPAMAACQAPNQLQLNRHRRGAAIRQANSHRRPHRLSDHRTLPIQRLIHQQLRNLNHLHHRQHLLAARSIQMLGTVIGTHGCRLQHFAGIAQGCVDA